MTIFGHSRPVERFARYWPLLALAASAGLVAIAHGFETFGHLAPCTLCLKEREVYWAAGTIAVIATVLSFSPWGRPVTRLANALLVLVFLYGAVLACYHAGAEWKFWPGPASCSGGHATVSAGELGAFLNGAPMAMPACDRPAWVFLGLSMAGWNALISFALAGASALAAAQGRVKEAPR